MSSTREQVLTNLLNRKRCTINELAEAVNINPISVRHHITRLEADGLVASEEERHGVGRPRRIYFLTNSGIETFPNRYFNLSNRLLEQLKEDLPTKMVNKLFTKIAGSMAEDFARELNINNLSSEERINILEHLLTEEGFTVEIERQGDKFLINETSCPYYHVGKDHPEVCILDETLITTLLGTPVEQTQCVLDGDSHCTYETSSIIEIQN
ncbi:MAG: winged helix-turn-helix transcriptional regulator [Chloroflexi bacterium]|nr:winged helix-turn-helix transcriptional regulator [Chloroflexota bacterium]